MTRSKPHKWRKRILRLGLLAAIGALVAKTRTRQQPPAGLAPESAPSPAPSPAPEPAPAPAAEPVSEADAEVPPVTHNPDGVSDPEVDPLDEGAPVVPDDTPGSFFEQVMAETADPPRRRRRTATPATPAETD